MRLVTGKFGVFENIARSGHDLVVTYDEASPVLWNTHLDNRLWHIFHRRDAGCRAV